MSESVNLTVDGAVSAEDEMFKGNSAHYFSVGKSALWNIERAISWAYPEPKAIERILDFPCGHGRVMRYLKAAFPNAELTGCDINREGVDFCAKQFGAIPVYSEFDPFQIPLPADHFDVIWVGSLFTHLDANRWRLFLRFLSSVLKPGGVLIFSTQGRQAYDWMTRAQYTYGLDARQVKRIRRQFEVTGFGYVDYRDQPDYGITLTKPAWVCQTITSMPQMRVVGYGEKCWDDHHDVVACVKDTEWMAATSPKDSTGLEVAGERLGINAALEYTRRILSRRRSA